MADENKPTEIEPQPKTDNHEIAEDSRNTRVDWLLALSVCAIAFITTCLVIFAYHKFVVSKSHSFAIVDLNEIIKIKQLQFEEILVKPNVTDSERMVAYDLVKNIGKDLPAALVELQAQCGCVILAKNAVISGESLDLTNQLKDLLGLAGLNSESMKEHLHAGKN